MILDNLPFAIDEHQIKKFKALPNFVVLSIRCRSTERVD